MTYATFSSTLTFPITHPSTASTTQAEPDWQALLSQHPRQVAPAVWPKVRHGRSLRSIIEIDQSTVRPTQTPHNETVDVTPHHDALVQELVDDEQLAAQLEVYAQANDYRAFRAEVATMHWAHHAPATLVRMIKLALSHAWLTLAETLIEQGREFFPHDPTIGQIARILAPPSITVVPGTAPQGLAASRMWVRTHATAYRGQWVAVYNGQLLGVAPSLDALRATIGPLEQPASTIITHIL